VTKLFRGCRYEVRYHAPRDLVESRWSRHHSYKAAHRAFREFVNNVRGDHAAGTPVTLYDVGEDGSGNQILEQGSAGWTT
jgi:hypothetical protein